MLHHDVSLDRSDLYFLYKDALAQLLIKVLDAK